MKKQMNDRLAYIHEKTDIPLDILKEKIFRFDFDLLQQVREIEGLDETTRDELLTEITELRGDFYDALSEVQDGSIKLGLDLQGGMHIVLEVNLVELMDRLAKNRDAIFDEISKSVHDKLFADPTANFEDVVREEFKDHDIPMARYFGDPRQSDAEIIRYIRKQAEEAIDLTLTKLRNRVDEFGVSEPSITKQGSRRIVVELPGVQDPTRARNLIGRTALLEFKLVAKPEITAKIVRDIDEIVKKSLDESSETLDAETAEEKLETDLAVVPETDVKEETVGEESDSAKSKFEETFIDEQAPVGEDTTFAFDKDQPFVSLLNVGDRQIVVLDKNKDAVERYIGWTEVQDQIPPEYEFLWHYKMDERGGDKFWYLYLVHSRAELTGAALSDAQVNLSSGASNPGQAGQGIVTLTMKREGARKFARITGSNIGEHLAIVLDDKIHMAPRIKVRIPNGSAIIEGAETIEEADDLAIVLRAGSLPAPVRIIEERTVGPSLGADSIKAGAFSAIVGIILVMIFMAFYYRGSGLIADFALLLNVIFLMAVLGGFGFTLTLPGIAGIILTIGMAVDANVLIFERIREELASGKTVWNSIQAGFGRAFVTIMDANITTLIAGIVLYQFGTGPLKGFALTLMIGIVASMFTALVVSKAIFDYITTTKSLKTLSI
ncbi:MAG: protein translocase subunit SecD [Candidatus Electryonea clarkiae]|nr:protein translocase subunit SecD [Candidatus Electryonea clarkiae]MDP8287663.1 protein translocase subunit SecD [Candidatus Electryonea clarkiae]